jgi:hypothetical protein
VFKEKHMNLMRIHNRFGVGPIARTPQMLKRSVLVLLLLAGPVWANELVFPGAYMSFVLPNPPYQPEDLRIELTLGYDDPENTIGDGIWLTGPGIIDLSSDPDLAGFLALATNGVDNPMMVSLRDAAGSQKRYGGFPSTRFSVGRLSTSTWHHWTSRGCE